MQKRWKISKRKSRTKFRRGASKTHKFNISGRPMRGGIRL